MARKPERKAANPPTPDKPQLRQKIKGTRPNQIAYLKSMSSNQVTFGLGASGTGKSFMAAGFAAMALAEGLVERIVLSRPMAQCGGTNLGFLPGSAGDKVSPFMAPLFDSLEAFYCRGDIDKMLASDTIRVTPLELMRGSSYKDSIVVIDEAQNCTRIQLEMALTRIDRGTKLIFTGDERQSDVGVSPLIEVVKKLRSPRLLEGIGVVTFTREDNMRSQVVAAIAERLGI